MLAVEIVLLVLAGAGALWLLLPVIPHLIPAGRAEEDPEAGLVIFAESIRWLGVRWGLNPLTRELRRAGYRGEIRYWRWHATWRGWLALPAIMDARLLEEQAEQLADYIAQQRRERPDRPIHLLGYSAGAFVAVRALELLPDGVQVDRAVLLAGAVDPARDLTAACRAVRAPMLVCWSLADWLILGLGTLLFGTGDRKHTASIGMVGPRGPGRNCSAVREIPWRPWMASLGHFGGHFSAPAPRFLRRFVVPALQG